ncbi:hypothetical protein BS78_05G150400 [Paspalum vaginatum]|nr:hypothetical protein BS78_05G150400 [Paspalum vaginatum]
MGGPSHGGRGLGGVAVELLLEHTAFMLCLQGSCVKNKFNREKVQYPQCTGSQSYIAKAYILVDIEEMVATPVEDGQQPKSPTEVVSNVLPGSSVFLRNVGLQSVSKKSSAATVSANVQQL